MALGLQSIKVFLSLYSALSFSSSSFSPVAVKNIASITISPFFMDRYSPSKVLPSTNPICLGSPNIALKQHQQFPLLERPHFFIGLTDVLQSFKN